MDLETLLTGTKWEILQMLAEKKRSPLELAKILNTTIANISQQLRLLQAAGLVKKERAEGTKRAEGIGAGKPRTLFSIAYEFAFVIMVSDKTAKKKMVKLTHDKKKVLNQWIK